MKRLLKLITIIIIIVILFVTFSGIYGIQSVDDLAYAVALGIDVGDQNNLKVTFQFTRPNSSGENASGELAPTTTISVESSSIDAAIHLMNTYISKKINLAHCKAIIFSEEFAQKGIKRELNALMNKVEVRPDASLIISKCTAKEYISSVKPDLENLVAKYYEISPNSSDYTAYTSNIMIGKFYNKLNCTTCHPIAILGGISSTLSHSTSSNSQKDEQAKAGESPLEVNNKAENIGLAVFKEDKLVGELNGIQTLCYSIVTNTLNNATISFSINEDENNTIDLYLYKFKPNKIDVKIVNGSPYISISIGLKAKILSGDTYSSELTEEGLERVSTATNLYLKKQILAYLYKTTKDFKSDVSGFGKYATPLFLTMQEWEDYNWLENYVDSFFEVSVDTQIDSSFLLNNL